MRVKIIIESSGKTLELHPENSIESEVLKKLPPRLEVKQISGNGGLYVLLFEDSDKTKDWQAIDTTSEDRSKLEQLKETHNLEKNPDYQDLRKEIEKRAVEERSKTEQLINSAKESTHGSSPVDDSPFERALKR